MEYVVKIRENTKELILYVSLISLVLFLLFFIGSGMKTAIHLCIYFLILQIIVFGYLYLRKKCNISIKEDKIYFNEFAYNINLLKYVCVYTISYPEGICGTVESVHEYRRVQFVLKEGSKYISKIFDEKEIGENNFNKLQEFIINVRDFYEDVEVIINYQCIATVEDKKPSKILAKIRLERMKENGI